MKNMRLTIDNSTIINRTMMPSVPTESDGEELSSLLQRPVTPAHGNYSCNLTGVPRVCTCRLGSAISCRGAQLQQLPTGLDSRVLDLFLVNNSLNISSLTFLGFQELRSLHLDYNSLSSLPDGAFSELFSLTELSLTHNDLQDVSVDALAGLQSLQKLDLSHNRLLCIASVLQALPALLSLHADYNFIDLRGPSLFHPRLITLSLSHNRVSRLGYSNFTALPQLSALYLTHNEIETIDNLAFSNQTELVELDLNYNSLTSVSAATMSGLTSLKSLDLSGNPLTIIDSELFLQLPALVSLYLRDVELEPQGLENISAIIEINVAHVHFKRFRYCRYLVPEVRDCHPKTDGVSTWDDLLMHSGLRVAVWLVAGVTVAGNMAVVAGRWLTADDNKVLSLFVRNLAMADCMTGLYLLVIGSKDLQYRSAYRDHAKAWMTSMPCTLIGILAVVAAEVSLLLLTVLSVQRWQCITWPLERPRLRASHTRVLLGGVWVLGLAIAVLPVLQYHMVFYGSNGVCFPLHLDDPWAPGWRYSTALLLGLNLACVLVIALSYSAMLGNIRATRACTPLALDDKEFILRFFFIVFTDCLCWTPIIVFKVLALTSLDIPPVLYPYVVVLLLPINSALNPFLYTFTTPKFRARASKLCANFVLLHHRGSAYSGREISLEPTQDTDAGSRVPATEATVQVESPPTITVTTTETPAVDMHKQILTSCSCDHGAEPLLPWTLHQKSAIAIGENEDAIL